MLSGGESISEKKQISTIKGNKEDQCSRYGYFEDTKGYKKIPGNICVGGTDLNPISTKCEAGFLGYAWSTIFMVVGAVAACYFGWDYIEAILVLLPIPDPAMLKQQVAHYCGVLTGVFSKGAKKLPGKKDDPAEMTGYSQNFDGAPVAMKDNEDEEDDEEDVGRHRSTATNDLNYDSDEKLELAGEEDLIQMN